MGESALVNSILGTLTGVEPVSYQSAVHIPANDRTLTTTRYQIGVDGTLTGIEVETIAGSPSRDLFVKVTLEDDQKIEMGTLCQGYIDGATTPHGSGAKPIKATWNLRLDSWGYVSNVNLVLRGTILSKKRQAGGWTGTNEDSLTGQGKLRQITGSTPAAGAEVSETVPTGARWKLLSCHLYLLNSATVATREPSLQQGYAASAILTRVYSNAASTANGAARMYHSIGTQIIDSTQSGNSQTLPLPDILMLAGWSIKTTTAALQAGDQYNAPLMLVEDYIDIA